MYCQKCKLDMGKAEFCEVCGGDTVELTETVKESIRKESSNDKIKLVISALVGAAIVVGGVFAYNTLKPKPKTFEEAFQQTYGIELETTTKPEEVRPEMTQEITDQLKEVGDKFISMYYANASKEEYAEFFTVDSPSYKEGTLDTFKFDRDTDDNVEINDTIIVESSLQDEINATLKLNANITADGYDYNKISEVSAIEDALIRVERTERFIFYFSKIDDKWLITKVSKPIV